MCVVTDALVYVIMNKLNPSEITRNKYTNPESE